jgi:hypothetical protein
MVEWIADLLNRYGLADARFWGQLFGLLIVTIAVVKIVRLVAQKPRIVRLPAETTEKLVAKLRLTITVRERRIKEMETEAIRYRAIIERLTERLKEDYRLMVFGATKPDAIHTFDPGKLMAQILGIDTIDGTNGTGIQLALFGETDAELIDRLLAEIAAEEAATAPVGATA